ncbi:MAG TPA: translocation/assembly module TamB domain-containing protein [Longimicrobiales bacterium]|nr:translocation/assembly module TamB domain-containing protein [Longimicrobiales bacterium]
MSRSSRHPALRFAGWTVAVAVSLGGLALLALQVDAVGTAAFRAVAGRVAPDLTVGRVSGSWVRGLTLERIAYADTSGLSVTADTVRLGYAPWRWRPGRIHLGDAEVVGLRMAITAQGAPDGAAADTVPDGGASPDPEDAPDTASSGGWALELERVALRPGPLDRPMEEPASDGAFRVEGVEGEVSGVEIAGGVRAETWRLDAGFAPAGYAAGWGSLAARGSLAPDGLRLDTLSVTSPRSRVVGRGWVPFDSTLVQAGGVRGSLHADPLALADLQGLTRVPGVLAGDSLVLHLQSATVGDSAVVGLEARTSAGAVVDVGLTWGRAGEGWGGHLDGEISGLDLDRYVASPLPPGPLRATVSLAGDGRWAGGLRELSAELQVEAAAPGVAFVATGAATRRPGAVAPRDSLALVVDTLLWEELGLRAGRIWAARSGSRVDWRLDVSPLPSGRLRGTGTLEDPEGDGPLRYAGDLRLDTLAEPRSDTRLSGDIRIEGEGLNRPRLRSTVALGSSRVAGLPVDTLELDLSWVGEDGEVTGTATGPGGRLTWDLEGHTDPAGGRVEIRSLRLDSLLPPVGDTLGPLPRLDGEVAGHLAWQGPIAALSDPARLSGAATVRLRGTAVGRDGTPADSVPGGPAREGAPGDERSVPEVAPPEAPGNVRDEAAEDSGPATVPAYATWSSALDSVAGDATWDAGRVEARVDAVLAGGDARIRLSGTLLEGLDLVLEEGQLRGIDLSALLAAAPETSLNGAIEGRVTRAPGDSLPRGRVALRLGPSTVRGDSVRLVDLDLELDADSLRGSLVAELAGGTVQADLRAPPGALPDRWTLEADAVLPRLGAFVDQPDSAVSASAHLSARADGAGAVQASLVVRELTGWGARMDTLVARGAVNGGTLAVDTLLVRSDVVRIDGGGSLPLAMVVSGESPPPSPGASHRMSLQVVVPDSAGTVTLGNTAIRPGPGQLQVYATCDGPGCQVTGVASLGTVLVGSTSLLAFDGSFSGELRPGGRVAAGRADLVASGLRTPALDVRHATLDLDWDGQEAALQVDATLDDRRSAQIELRAEPAAELRSVTFDRIALQLDQDAWTLTRPATVALTPDGLDLDSLEVTAGEQRVLAHVRTLETGRDLVLQVDSLRIAAISDLLDRPELGGRVSGALEIQRSGDVPSLVGTMEASVRRDDVPVHQIHVEALGTADTLTVQATVTDPQGRTRATLDVGTTIARLSRDDWRAELAVDSLPLGWAALYAPPTTVSEAGGTLDSRLEIRGGEGGLQVEGPVTLTGGRVTVVPTDVAYTGIEARISARGRTLEIDSLHVVSRGTADLSGLVTFPEDQGPVELDLTVRGEEFLAVDTRSLTAVVSPELAVSGTVNLPTVTGNVTVVEGSFRLPESRLGGNVAAVTLTDEDWAILQTRFGIARPDPREASRWIPRDAVLDLSVTLGRDIWLRKDDAPEMAIQFTGEFSAAKESDEAELQLDGEIQAITQRSYVEEFGRRFDITEGSVRLDGPVRATRLAATARYRVPTRGDDEDQVNIRLSVEGVMDDLALSLDSEPSMDNADIVSYLATGRPANTAFSGESTSARDLGIEIVTSQITGSLERFAQQQVGLDVIEIQQDGLQGTTLLAGKYVTPRLFVGFRQGMVFQPEDGHSFSKGLSADAEAEYQALDWLVASVRGGTSSIRVFLEGSYGW